MSYTLNTMTKTLDKSARDMIPIIIKPLLETGVSLPVKRYFSFFYFSEFW